MLLAVVDGGDDVGEDVLGVVVEEALLFLPKVQLVRAVNLKPVPVNDGATDEGFEVVDVDNGAADFMGEVEVEVDAIGVVDAAVFAPSPSFESVFSVEIGGFPIADEKAKGFTENALGIEEASEAAGAELLGEACLLSDAAVSPSESFPGETPKLSFTGAHELTVGFGTKCAGGAGSLLPASNDSMLGFDTPPARLTETFLHTSNKQQIKNGVSLQEALVGKPRNNMTKKWV